MRRLEAIEGHTKVTQQGGELVAENLAPLRPTTHDILPDSSSGTYFAAGALIGSTLAE
jgi:hypothetical protein